MFELMAQYTYNKSDGPESAGMHALGEFTALLSGKPRSGALVCRKFGMAPL